MNIRRQNIPNLLEVLFFVLSRCQAPLVIFVLKGVSVPNLKSSFHVESASTKIPSQFLILQLYWLLHYNLSVVLMQFVVSLRLRPGRNVNTLG